MMAVRKADNLVSLKPGASWGELVAAYLAHRVGQRTLGAMAARNHRSVLGRFAEAMGEVPPHSLSPADVERWLESISGLRPSTRRGHFSAVRTFCTWLVRAGVLKRNPAFDVASPRQPRSVPRALDAELVAATLAQVPDSRGVAIVWLMVGMGLRCCEVSRLELGQWDRRGGVMTVRGKGNHERVLPVPAEVVTAIDLYLAEYPTAAGPLIRSFRRPTQALSPDAVSGLVSEWMRIARAKRAARDGVSAHALRATAASDVLDACGDLRVVQEMLGHQNLATTSIYLRRAGLPQMRKAMGGRSYQPRPSLPQDAPPAA